MIPLSDAQIQTTAAHSELGLKLLDVLRMYREPMTAGALAGATGQHAEDVRGALAKLNETGDVEKIFGETQIPGTKGNKDKGDRRSYSTVTWRAV